VDRRLLAAAIALLHCRRLPRQAVLPERHRQRQGRIRLLSAFGDGGSDGAFGGDGRWFFGFGDG